MQTIHPALFVNGLVFTLGMHGFAENKGIYCMGKGDLVMAFVIDPLNAMLETGAVHSNQEPMVRNSYNEHNIT